MELQQFSDADARVHAENIGGIRETSTGFSPGVTILVGRNASNRTSFLQAVMAVLGSKNVTIKGDADEATVELTLGDETYTRQLRRGSDGGVVTDGKPYLDDSTLPDLFAFLLESNESRRAVATGQDLRELIMQPVDTDEIQAEIDRLRDERDRLEAELDDIADLKRRLPELEEQRTQLQEQIETKRGELEAKEAEVEAADATVEETREEQSELQDKLEELRSKRSELENVRYDLETERESLETLQTERRNLETEWDELPDAPAGEINELDAELQQLRQQKQQLESEVSDLRSVIAFNEEQLEGAESGPFMELSGTDATHEAEDVTNQLLAENDDDEVTCWTCGSTVDRKQIEATLDRLRELSQQKVSEINELEDEIGNVKSEKRELEQAQRKRDRTERRATELEDDIDQTEATIEQLQDRRSELTDEVETIETEVEELEREDTSEVLKLHKEANQLEYELGQLESDLERVEGNIADIEDRIAEEGAVEAQIEEVSSEIEDLRTKIERIEQSTVEQFNEHMDTVLDMLEYANLERIWLERVEREVREGRRTVTKTMFELHVIRTTETGTAYEDTVDHLSESEREVTGLVFALAGYLAHEVYEELPFILMDSLEALDSERIATLVSYLINYTGYLLVALLPEDAAALPDEYERITEI